jgi:hypothetical protein
MYFLFGQVADVFVVPLQTDHTLAKFVLIAVHHHPPAVRGIHLIGS